MALVDLLAQGKVTEYNAERPNRGRLDLFAADLPNISLVGADLSGADLSKSDLTESDLTDANLMMTHMVGIDGSDLKLVGAMGLKCKLKEAWLEGADLTDSDFSQAKFNEANLSKTKGEGARFTGAKFSAVDAAGAIWPGAELSEAKLHNADFTEADLSGTSLDEARGAEAKFDRATFDHSTGRDLRLPESSFVSGSLKSVLWTAGNFGGSDFSKANLEHSDLTGSNLRDALFVGANLTGVTLAHAILDGADFSGADLTGANLIGSDPHALGLSEEQIASLASFGVGEAGVSPNHFKSLLSAQIGQCVALMWLNPGAEGAEDTIRYQIVGGKGAPAGVLQTSVNGLLGHYLVAQDGAFLMLVLIDRPGGIICRQYHLTKRGKLSAEPPLYFDYRPNGAPKLYLNEKGEPTLWGVDNRTGAIIVHGFGEEGLEHQGNIRISTAGEFCGWQTPLLRCKGGVVMSLQGPLGGKPLRTPDGFGGPLATGVAFEDRVMLLWMETPKSNSQPGGLRASWVGGRRGPEVESLTMGLGATTIDLFAQDDKLSVVWAGTELGSDNTSVIVMSLPTGLRSSFELEGIDVLQLKFSQCEVGTDPVIVCTTLEGDVVVVTVKGKIIVSLDGVES